jgi:hypothetical protein
MSEALLPAIPGQRHVQVSVTMQTGGCLALSLETLLVLQENQHDQAAAIRKATQSLLDSLPVKEVSKIEQSVAAEAEDADIVTKEPHPTFLKLVTEITKLNKTLEKNAEI